MELSGGEDDLGLILLDTAPACDRQTDRRICCGYGQTAVYNHRALKSPNSQQIHGINSLS